MVTYERSGWRPTDLMDWHRARHLLCRAAGVALLMLEYNRGCPVALVEYRRYEDGVPNTGHPIYRALAELAGDLPFVIAYYHRETWGFSVSPQNHAGRAAARGVSRVSEADFVAWLHQIRDNAPTAKDFPRGLGRNAPPSAPDLPMTVPGLICLNGASWEGEELSRKHRFWGPNCPAVDLDFFLIDNNGAIPVALVEYKHWRAQPVSKGSTNIRAQMVFSAAISLPFMAVTYWNGGGYRFKVEFVCNAPPPDDSVAMDEPGYVGYLRGLRQRRAA